MIYYINKTAQIKRIGNLEEGLKKKGIRAVVAEIFYGNFSKDFSIEFEKGTDIRDINKEEKFIAECLGTTPDEIKIQTPVPRSHSHCLIFTVPYNSLDKVKKEGANIVKINSKIEVKKQP